MRIFSLIACLGLAVGCVDSSGGVRKNPDKPISDGGIAQMAYEACQQRDLEAGKRLQELGADIKAGKKKYDSLVLDEIKRINTETAASAFSAVEQKLIDSFDPQKTKLDPQKVGEAVSNYGKGRARAGSEK